MKSGDQRIDSEFLVKLDDYYGLSIDTMLGRMLDEEKRCLSKRKWIWHSRGTKLYSG